MLSKLDRMCFGEQARPPSHLPWRSTPSQARYTSFQPPPTPFHTHTFHLTALVCAQLRSLGVRRWVRVQSGSFVEDSNALFASESDDDDDSGDDDGESTPAAELLPLYV